LINSAIVGQPYGLAYGWREDLIELVGNGCTLHVPPAGAYASICFPGATLFLVLTLPGVTVQWLPEQLAAIPELAPADHARDMQDVAARIAAGDLEAPKMCINAQGQTRCVTPVAVDIIG